MPTGKVKFYNEAKGFGFITDENGKDVFVHSSSVTETLREGDTVTFEMGEGKKGPMAVNVKRQ